MSRDELRTEMAEIPAKIYPGAFEDEVQATVSVNDKEVTVITSRNDVDLDQRPSETGTPGKLKVYLVEASDQGYLIDLPGEALGTTKRIRVDKSQLRRA